MHVCISKKYIVQFCLFLKFKKMVVCHFLCNLLCALNITFLKFSQVDFHFFVVLYYMNMSQFMQIPVDKL